MNDNQIKPKNKCGRKKKSLVSAEVVRSLSARGLTKEQIAASLGMHPRTFYRQQQENEEINLAFEAGRAHAVLLASDKLFEKALAGDNACLIFWLKARGGWRDTGHLEISGVNGGPVEVSDVKTKLLEKLARLGAENNEEGDESPATES